jgi:hypothetical protein
MTFNNGKLKEELIVKPKLHVLEQEIATDIRDGIEYICVVDIARFKHSELTDIIIGNWLRSRNTIGFLGICEQFNNSSFKPIEFDGFKKQLQSER